MEDSDSKNRGSWPQEALGSLEELQACINRTLASQGPDSRIAWRGQAKCKWGLEPTLDRELLKLKLHRDSWLDYELELLDRFRENARQYASDSELAHLKGDNWLLMGMARHAGLATRLLDWTFSPWAALWFASHEQNAQESDGLLWWFDTTQFNEVVKKRWCDYGVRTKASALGIDLGHELVERLGLHERYLDESAFEAPGKSWICQLHYRFPCSRMAAQHGFATVCGKLGLPHDQAIIALGDLNAVRRGKILIPANLKAEALAHLSSINIHAASLEYPALDECARQIMDDLRAGKLAPARSHSGQVQISNLPTSPSTNVPETYTV